MAHNKHCGGAGSTVKFMQEKSSVAPPFEGPILTNAGHGAPCHELEASGKHIPCHFDELRMTPWPADVVIKGTHLESTY